MDQDMLDLMCAEFKSFVVGTPYYAASYQSPKIIVSVLTL